MKTILLTGASGQIGSFLLQRLAGEDVSTLAVSRQPQSVSFGEQWLICDLFQSDPFDQVDHVDVWIHAGVLTLSVPWLASAARAGVKHIITFSTTSIFTKLHSSSPEECVLIERIRRAEQEVAQQCAALAMRWTILRPTLIYGRGTDQNIAFITSMIQRFGFFPLIAGGAALRQPVHADDLAKAVIDIMASSSACNRAYNLSGGEVLSYQAMVTRIFAALAKPVRMVNVPPMLYKIILLMLKHTIPRYAFIHTSMVDRMQQDMVFDHTEASRDFAYQPRSFQPLQGSE